MNDSNTRVLQPDALIKEMKDNSAAIIGALNDQWVTLQLLGGTLPTVVGVYSQFFSGMLSELALQSGLSSAQLGEQQLYDAASLESAAATYLLLDILSGNVERVVETLTTLAGHGQGLLDKAGELPALLEKLGGGEKSNIEKSGDILGGGLNILSNAQGAKELFKNSEGGPAILATGAKLFGSLLGGPALPVIIGAVVAAVGGFFALKALKSAIQKEQPSSEGEDDAKTSSDNSAATPAAAPANTAPDESRASSPHVIDPTDPFKTGAGEESNYNQYQSRLDSSRQNAAELRDAVEKGNSEVAVQLDKVAEMLRRLAEKPADRNIKSEVVIQSLHTTQTLSEFRDMLTELLKYDEQISI